MLPRIKMVKFITWQRALVSLLIFAALLLAGPSAWQPVAASEPAAEPASPSTLCSGGPTIDGILLDECVVESFTVSGVNKTVTVWYTNSTASATRTVDGVTHTLFHGVNNDTLPQDIAQSGREAWESYFTVYNHQPYHDGCGGNINVRLEDGIGWGGVAYWASSGDCWIGIDSPNVNAGAGQGITYHEFHHYLQYSYNSGCYDYIYHHYDSGSAAGAAEFIDGYADLAEDTVDTTLDASDYNGYVSGYNPLESFYDKRYFIVFNKYFAEQLGALYTTTEPHHHMDAVRQHYEMCDAQDTLYVFDDLIPALKPGMNEKKLFLNFFAANWAKDWANHTTNPELVYLDDNPTDAALAPAGPSYGAIPLWKNENLSGGSLSYPGETTPDDWAARYYQINPQAGCSYLTTQVNGAPGAQLGINLMAAQTSTPSLQRVAWMGEDFVRTFSAATASGGHNRIAAVINAFSSNYSYDINFSCVNPSLEIIEPGYPQYALVGEPASPLAFLGRFRVISAGSPVLGLDASNFSATAEGDPVTFVPGSFSQSGEEYWAIMLPPTKTLGTTFVDLTVCLDGAICATETDALLYANPGNTDFALVFDASGSMATEDITGEGKRVENAQKAGNVLADLLQVGDRILVTDFSAKNNPAGCGLPSGSGNCELDIQQRLARTDVTAPASTAINATRAAINNISARDWTPIGAALRDGKNRLLAAPTNTNHKHMVLLSDGQENVLPLYNDIKAELIASGVIVDTIAFSEEANIPLMAQIAAETGGIMRYVPTTSGTLRQPTPEQIEALVRQGAPPAMIDSLTTVVLPGQLALADVYDYYETRGQDAARLFHDNYTTIASNTWQEKTQYVDAFVTTLRLVVSGKQEDMHFYGACSGYHRFVEVLPAGAGPRDWIPVSDPYSTVPIPAGWDVRNNRYDDVVIIPAPAVGTWKVRTKYDYAVCRDGVVDEAATAAALARSDGAAPGAPTVLESDFMMNGSVESNVRLEGRFLPPIVKNQGQPGDRVPIVAVAMSRWGGVPGLLVAAAVEKPGSGVDYLLLVDDGLHRDGAANDGIYGALYTKTNVGGAYNVRILAIGANWATREWLGSFWIKPLWEVDLDKDGLPDGWEHDCNLNNPGSHREGDPDHDQLYNYQEFQAGTIPCDPDTDDGGEMDGSEVFNKRDPLNPVDDVVRPLGHFNVRALNGLLRIQWTHPLSYTTMLAYVSTDPDQLGTAVDMGTGGEFELPGLQNDVKYYVRLMGQNGTAGGEVSQAEVVTPKADPIAPHGVVLINQGAFTTAQRWVQLNLSAQDTPIESPHLAGAAVPGLRPEWTTFAVSGAIEMRISNEVTFSGAAWEPFSFEKAWILADGPVGLYRVYVQFRDGADNLSAVVSDSIERLNGLFLPVVKK